MAESQSQISYSIKELLAQINQKLDVMTIGLNSKADHVELEKAKGRIDTLEREGPPIAQEAAKKVELLEEKVRTIDSNMATQEAIDSAFKSIKSNRTVALFTIVGLLIQFGGLVAVFIFKQ